MKGFTLVELIVVIAITGILGAIALPTYFNYIIKANMTEIMSAATICKNSITEASQTGFAIPPNTGDVFSCYTSSPKVATLSVDKNGLISIQTQNIPHLGTKTNLELVPYSDTAATVLITAADFTISSGKEIRIWKCRPKQDATGIDIRYLLTSCR